MGLHVVMGTGHDERVTIEGAAVAAPHSAPPVGSTYEAEELLRYRPPHPVLFVIFGATGDLSRRKLLPSLYNLAAQGLLPDEFILMGAAREGMRREGVPSVPGQGPGRPPRPRPPREAGPRPVP